jgi:hypothetical protein
MIDIQIYNNDKKIRHISNVWWDKAKEWLIYTQEKLQVKFTSIDVQIYTWQNMPVDNNEFKTFEETI